MFHDDDPFFQRSLTILKLPPPILGMIDVFFDNRKRTSILHTMQQHATRRMIHVFIPYENIFFFAIVYETMAGSSTMIIVVIMMMVMVFSSASAGGFFLIDPLGLFTGGGTGTSPGSSGDAGEGDPTDFTDRDCIVYKDEQCSGKSGKDRDSCVKTAKKECVDGGGWWDTKKHEEEVKNYIVHADSGEKLKVPETMRGDTNEDCIYFYDMESPEKWSADYAPKVHTRGYWCLGDNKDGAVYGDKNAFESEGFKGTRINKNKVDHARIGKNVRVHIWPADSDGGKGGSIPVTGKGTPFTIEGKEYGTGKVYSFKSSPIGYDNLDAFQVAKTGEEFVNL